MIRTLKHRKCQTQDNSVLKRTDVVMAICPRFVRTDSPRRPKIYSLQDLARLCCTRMHSSSFTFFASFLQDRHFSCNLARFLQEFRKTFQPNTSLQDSCETLAYARRLARNSPSSQQMDYLAESARFPAKFIDEE